MKTGHSIVGMSAPGFHEVLHGVTIEDRFHWLEDQESLATRAFVHEEQRQYGEYLIRRRDLRSSIEARVSALLTVDAVDLPIQDNRGGLLFLKRCVGDEQKRLYQRTKSDEEKLLVSQEMLGTDTLASIAPLRVSRSGRYIAIGVRSGGEDVQEVRFYDVHSGKVLDDRLRKGFFRGLEFDLNETGFYYAQEEVDGLYLNRRAIRRHSIGTEQFRDEEIFSSGEGPGQRLMVHGSKDCSGLAYTVVSLASEPHVRCLLQELPLGGQPYVLVEMQGATFAAQIDGENVVALTTLQAPHGRIVFFARGNHEQMEWLTLVPESVCRISRFEILDCLIVVHYDTGADLTTTIFSKGGTLLRQIQYPSSGTCRLGRIDTAGLRLFYEHSDIHKPPTIYEVDLLTGEHSVWWYQTVSGLGEEPLIERHLYPALDGTPVPMTIVRNPRAPRPSPVLLTAYGGGGTKASPSFSILVTVLLERGFSCATAHIRGGGEGGIDWHASALGPRKQTSVDDLIAGAEWLLSNEYSTKEHLGCAGQSHGALMVLCATTQRPELFRAVMALGPIADLTRFHLFGVGRSFVTELGDPNDADDFGALYRLSPYHRVNDNVEYPAVLIISGDRDKRCDSLHSRKMIARLREVTKTQGPVLLDYLEERGHKPVLPLPVRIRSLTDRLTFLISELGTTETVGDGQ